MHIFIVIAVVVAIFYILSKNYIKKPSGNFDNRSFDILDAKFFVRLIAKVAKSDGVVSKEEAYYISLIFDDICNNLKNASIRYELKETYEREKNSSNTAFSIALEYKTKLHLSDRACVNIVMFLLNLAYIDGEFNSAEKKILNEICDGFGISKLIKDTLFERFESEFNHKQSSQSTTNKDPYEVLEINKDASFDEIKKQYRKLAKQNHPDFLMGADEKVISNATKRLQEINEAYAVLKAKFEK
ncbi:DnaJ domain-containing protein [Campylobacter fetus]|uniref:DnaJ domain-containing protein n=1 Tax=Campylobacter fetus TaxID=196 RepID=UPI000425399A|nr:DnaJ domain-containing protein [Campylobacter fetus]AGZ81444.2 DnaJ-like membrane chaperone protein (N-terminal terB-like domain) [Campylobacter fetus subsp. testudinum 03-427]AJB45193.1 molecular chaperone DnaJ [Campylobacter fetus subsp. testudinum]EAI4322488.1 molecular chaperone DjlA [Campylobacter fetus]EAI4391898.1 molecular chaperone DjlA [Campylobacter fetus]EAK0827261.1 molecular chaperone DjlA [Campylobacter fetus]